MTTPPPAGWYPDPADGRAWRWWDGATWTGYTAPRYLEERRRPAPSAPLGPLQAQERQLAPWAQAAAAVLPLAAVASGLLSLAYGGFWRRYSHWVHIAFHEIEQHQSVHQQAPTLPTPLYLLSPISLVATVLLLLWQYRAAKVAKAAGYPQRWSPGWGAASWVVPVVFWWMPYQALRDLLPPGHPRRRLVLRAWLLWLVVEGLSISMVVTLFVDGSVSAAQWVPLVVLGVAAAASLLQAVRVVEAEHATLGTGGG